MSDLNNPLFDNQREFLERQKEEYKNALMGDVDQIKSQSQEIGKKVAIAGGVVVAGLLLRRMFGSSKKKSKKVKKEDKSLHTRPTSSVPPVSAGVADYHSLVHDQEDGYTLSSERMHHTPNPEKPRKQKSEGFLKSELGQVITQQLTALLLVYITKKVEEYLSSESKNADIAVQPIEVTQIETTEYILPKEDAV